MGYFRGTGKDEMGGGTGGKLGDVTMGKRKTGGDGTHKRKVAREGVWVQG